MPGHKRNKRSCRRHGAVHGFRKKDCPYTFDIDTSKSKQLNGNDKVSLPVNDFVFDYTKIKLLGYRPTKSIDYEIESILSTLR